LWQSSGYIGSYGDLVSPQIRKYIHNWAGERSSLELREADSLDLEFEGSDERETPRREAVASDELPRGL
jgi:hypothetical protein